MSSLVKSRSLGRTSGLVTDLPEIALGFKMAQRQKSVSRAVVRKTPNRIKPTFIPAGVKTVEIKAPIIATRDKTNSISSAVKVIF